MAGSLAERMVYSMDDGTAEYLVESMAAMMAGYWVVWWADSMVECLAASRADVMVDTKGDTKD